MQDLLSQAGIDAYQANFDKAMKRIDALAKRCIDTTPKDGPVKFMCDEAGRIDITFLDAEISAAPRMVHRERKGFTPEWSFYATNGSGSCFVWRFYLDDDGNLCEKLPGSGAGEEAFWTGLSLASYIIGKLVPRLVASRLYALTDPVTAT
jgi:hypothetical protein